MSPGFFVRIKDGVAIRNAQVVAATGSPDPAEMYRALGISYPKFFKMDRLCKWAFIGAELLLRNDEAGNWRYKGADRSRVAVVMSTADGCLEADKRYNESRAGIASPALFVYTLPNIMLGEICIRHGFTGEQLCESREAFDTEAIFFWVEDLLLRRGATHCLFGWADAVEDYHDVCLFWLDAASIKDTSPEELARRYDTPVGSGKSLQG